MICLLIIRKKTSLLLVRSMHLEEINRCSFDNLSQDNYLSSQYALLKISFLSKKYQENINLVFHHSIAAAINLIIAFCHSRKIC